MASPTDRPLLGRHNLYKAAQVKVVAWLLSVSKGCQGLVDVSTSKVSSIELIDLAEGVRDARIEVPVAIVSLLQDIIEGREACAAWYRQQPGSDSAVDESHQWFVKLLKQVRGILKSANSSKFDEGTSASDHMDVHATESIKTHLANLFANLELEEPSESPLGQKPTPPPPSQSQSTAEKSKLEDDGSSLAFDLWCLLKDLDDVRKFIRQAWLQYAAGAISVVAASAVTETGIGLMRLKNEEFISQHSDFQDWWHLLRYFSLGAFGQDNFTYIFPLDSSASNGADEDLIDLICPAAAFLLRDVRSDMKSYAHTKSGEYDLRPGRTPPMATRLRILEPEEYQFSSIFRFQVPQLLTYVRAGSSESSRRPSTQMFERMEFLAGIEDYYNSGTLPIWLVSACAIHIDMYEVIGDKPGVAASAWLDSNRQMEHQLDRVCKMFDDGGSTYCPFQAWKDELSPIFQQRKTFDDVLRGTEHGVKVGEDDYYRRNKESVLGRASSSVMGMPSMAGALLFNNMMAYHKVGIRFANDNLVTLALATLYTTVTRLGLMKNTWEDMNFLLATQKSSTPLIPKSSKPNDASTLFRQYLLALGVPVDSARSTNIMDTKIPLARHVHKKHRRNVHPTSAYVSALTQGFHANEALGTFERGDLVETVLTELVKDSKRSSGSSQQKGKLMMPKPSQFTLTELLSVLKQHIVLDELHLNFDYPGFYMLCEELRCKLIALDPHFKPNEIGIAPWEVVFYIIGDAALSHAPPSPNSLLDRAAKALSDTIDAPGVGNRFSKEARSRSSGSIPKDAAPKIEPYDPTWTAELWNSFSSECRDIQGISGHVESSSASHITLYDPKGSKARFNRIVPAADRFWRLLGRGMIRLKTQKAGSGEIEELLG